MRTLPVLALAVFAAIAAGQGFPINRSAPREGGSLAENQQQKTPPPTFQSETNFVEVPVAVLDKQDRFVTGLQGTDFAVFEDGKLQTISAFSFVDLHAQPGEEPLAPTNDTARAAISTEPQSPEGAVYVLLIDNLHIDFENTAALRTAVRQFIENDLGPNDVAAVVNTRGRLEAMQDFTTDRKLLVAAAERSVGQAPLAEQAINPEHSERATLETIRSIATSLPSFRAKRKALVLFSEGITPPRVGSRTQRDFDETLSAALRGDLFIYSVDPAGLKLAGGRADMGDGVLCAETAAAAGHEGIVWLALNTGGFPVVDTNRLAAGFKRISEVNTRYYLLGYRSPKQDGKFHEIEVKVRLQGVTVHSRPGYTAAKPDKKKRPPM